MELISSLIWIGKCVFLVLFTALIGLSITISHRKSRSRKMLGNTFVHHLGYPFFGLLYDVLHCKNVQDIYEFIDSLTPTGCERSSFWILHKNWICLSKPNDIEKVVLSPDAIEKTDEYRIFELVADGIFIARKNKWKIMRRAVNRTFTSAQLDSYYNSVLDLSKICSRTLGKTDGFVNIHPFIGRYYLDMILKTHFGLNTNEQENARYKALEAVNIMLSIALSIQVMRPYFHYKSIVKLTKYYNIHMENSKHLYQPIKESAIERYPKWKERKEKNGGKPINYNLMDYYFQTVDELRLEQNLLNYCLLASDIIIAGTDTTSIANSTLLYFIAACPDVQEKLYREVIEHMPEDNNLTKHILNSMTYLDMCIMEAIRHASPPGVLRYLTQDLRLDDNCTLPKNSNIYITLKCLHFDPKYFEKPNEYYPEHFLPEAVEARPKYSFIPFSAGPRSCPGVNYGLQAIKTCTAYIVKDYYLETNLAFDKVKWQIHFMREFVQGYPVKFTRRNNLSRNEE